ncbi:MAG: SCO family protein [Deltaproteobacteria bacterium]|nr:SCO family protein [Deltaproteobacteria bacterium]
MSHTAITASKVGGSTSAATAALLFAWLFSTMFLWLFAFYEDPSGVPDWVRQAQLACFGSNESGLPNAAGWMLLTLSPALFLGAILMALGPEVSAILTAAFSSRNGRVVALITALLILCEAGWVAAAMNSRLQRESEINFESSGALLPKSYPRGTGPAPDFTLIDQAGVQRTLSSLRGKPIVLSFVFAHCQAICPTLVRTIQSVPGASEGQFHTVLITLDPWRDTPASLPGLARKWQLTPNQLILSGSPEQVNAALDAFKVPRERDQKNGDVIHPSLVYLISSEGELAYTFNGPSPDWIKQAIARLSSAKDS